VISQEWGKDLEVFTNNHTSTRFSEHIIRKGHVTFEIQPLVWDMRDNMAGLNPFIYHSTFLFIIRRKTQFVPHIAYQKTVHKTTCKPQNVQMPHTVGHSKKEAKTTNQYMITSGRRCDILNE
jgi:hypothetical protein